MNTLCAVISIALLNSVSACIDGTCRRIEFPSYLSYVGKRLINHVIRTIPNMDQDSCEWQCYLDHNCVSINLQFQGIKQVCELNNSTHNEHHQDFVEEDGYFYRGTENTCRASPCQNNATCQSGFTNTRYRCLCTSGFTGHDCGVDIDECSHINGCSKHAQCKNTAGSYNCSCKGGYLGDGYTCKKPEFYINSSILSHNEEYLSHLSWFLVSAVGNVSHWLLCFRPSLHGAVDQYFHNRCNGRNDTITIIKENNYVFGGYVDIPWESSSKYKYGKTANAFIYSLNNSEGSGAFKSMVKNPEMATYYHKYLGPTFGTNDIRVDFKNVYEQSVANFGNNYNLPSNVIINNPRTILAGVTHFEPDEVEVFYMKRTGP
ncbi:uncharacterized protein LOC111335915 isoform X2 [Stylophora pistillata]|uniref:uncharacterized protein LOC111335915 isoform X2 n=1 Tax=Stylophora pistillata TaxID=50429 RepID=UPI000C0434A0|nr:uncharacterized protein LOC111335915 isoform X2 [Stylophora pistillata]